ncbi:MAG: cell division protein SepF [Candidatus Scatovivens sp.]
MSVPAIKKIMNYLWGENEESEAQDYNEEYNQVDYDYDEDDNESTGETLSLFKRKNKVVTMPQQQIKMKISKPTNFDQVDEIIVELKQKNAVVINLEYVSKDVARRIVDVVSGATKAIDGHMEKVSNSIFVVAPFNYDIVNEITKEKIESKFSASWIK